MKISKLLILFFTISLGSLSIALDVSLDELLKIPQSEVQKTVNGIFSFLDIETPIRLHNLTAKLYLYDIVKLVKDVPGIKMIFPGLKDSDILIFADLYFINENGSRIFSDSKLLPLKSITDAKGHFKQKGSFTLYEPASNSILSHYSHSFEKLSKYVHKKVVGGFDSPNEKIYKHIFVMPSIPVKIDYPSSEFISYSMSKEAIRKIENLKQKQEKIRSRL